VSTELSGIAGIILAVALRFGTFPVESPHGTPQAAGNHHSGGIERLVHMSIQGGQSMIGDHERLMRVALEDAARAKAEGNVAVGSVITQGEAVVARGRNLVTSTFDPTAHAETVALREAGRALRQVDFSGCVLYTTFEPCPMCCGAILASGISTLVMGGRPAPAERRWGEFTVERFIELARRGDSLQVITGILTQECLDIRQGETGR
jgi:tRNA(adenine34) deaminase